MNTLQKNEMAKRDYFEYLRDIERFSEDSIAAFEKSILNWQDFTKNADFSNFNKKQAVEFRDWLKNRKKKNTEEKISLSYAYNILRLLRSFFEWLALQPKYRSRINPSFINCLKLSRNETRAAIQSKKKNVPTVEEIKTVIESIEVKNDVDNRDRAIISLLYLSGIRLSALISLPIKSFDRNKLVIDQDPNFEIKTKLRKRITTALVPLSFAKPLDYFTSWYDYLVKEKKFKPDDPIFPATKKEQGAENICYFSTGEIEPIFWKSGSSVRKILEKRFIKAGVPYYKPHIFRDLIVKEFIQSPLTEEQKKAISQNLGHNDVVTTFGSYGYGKIAEDRQIEIVQGIKLNNEKSEKILGNIAVNSNKKEFAEYLRNIADNLAQD